MRDATAGPVVARIAQLLAAVRGCALDDTALVHAAGELAGLLFAAAAELERPVERERRVLLTRMLQDPAGQAFATLLADRVHRSDDPSRIVDAARQLLRRLGVPRYLPWVARAQLTALLRLGPFVPRAAARGLLARLRAETEHVVLDAREEELAPHLAARRLRGVDVNLNLLGEAVLSDRDADARLAAYERLLVRDGVEHISVKLSSLSSQLELLSWERTVDALCARLTRLYRLALEQSSPARPFGKLITLDMEAYRHLELTLSVFVRALEQPALRGLQAGIALQAYLPESARILRELTEFARARRATGAAPIRVRLVKGANLLAERVEGSLRGLAVPILPTKAEVDASYKRLLFYGAEPEHARAVHLGIGSHNVFDLALALVLRASRELDAELSVELLEGMADPLRRVLEQLGQKVLVYTPIVEPSSMQSAIAYLMRRLDEGTAEENFLRRGLTMQVGDACFASEHASFEAAVRTRAALSESPRRAQHRGSEQPGTPVPFQNQSDTDFAHADNRRWVLQEVERVAAWGLSSAAERVPLRIAGERLFRAPTLDGFDPSRPGVVPYQVALASPADVARALASGKRALERWAKTSLAARAELLRRIGQELQWARGSLIAAMVLDAGKRIEQADLEVSEAIDFAFYYAESALEIERSCPELELQPIGVGLVTPPWNFPLAIPAGGVFALLMSGHSVILKPALETPLVAARLHDAIERAGADKDLVQLVVCEDQVASALVKDARVGRVVLTGATSTAQLFMSMRPDLALAAETGGKNAIVVTARADRDQAIEDVLASAFGHAGQKCSACSLLVLEAELYDDMGFLGTLRDAASSLVVGSAFDPASVVTPLIRPPEGALRRALDTLEPAESWLLPPRTDPANPRLLSPAIKLGVREGSFMHTTELFGPVLSVMRARDLEHAIAVVNATPYGLTSGLHSLEENEQARWASKLNAGNLYINRGITGAIVRRQPFGGLKASSFGRGAKAGGPSYVWQLGAVTQREPPKVTTPPTPATAELVTEVRGLLTEPERSRLGLGACSYGHAFAETFEIEHDPSQVIGERNAFVYLPCKPMLIRAGADADPVDLLLALAAARTVGAQLKCSAAHGLIRKRPQLANVWTLLGVTVESAQAATQRVAAVVRVRTLGTPEHELREAALAAGVHLEDAPVLMTGRIELLRYVQEQSRSVRYHRFGNLTALRLSPALHARKRA